MEITTEIKYIRISPRKLRLLADGLRGLSLQEALDRLQFIGKSAASPLFKSIKSAIANAQNNAKLDIEDLKIKTLEISGGSAFKRWRPVARGQAHSFRRRTSHIRLILEGKK